MTGSMLHSPKDKKIYKKHAHAQGESVNAFIVRSVNETMRRDNQK